jgi:cell division protein FtsQ
LAQSGPRAKQSAMSDDEPPKRRGRKRTNSVKAPSEETEPEAAPPSPRISRALTAVLKVVTFVVLLGTAIGGFAYGANHFFVSTSRFAIRHIEAEGSRRFGEDQLLGLAGISRGDNLFSIDLPTAEQQLSSNPWIESARLTRRIPDTLTVVVTEHVAVALASIDESLYLVTEDGYPIKPFEEGDSHNFPVISGVSAEDLRVDRARALERIASAIAILRRYERLPMADAYAAQEINMASDGAVQLVVGNSAITFNLGQGPFRQKLLMAGRVLGKLGAKRQTPSIVFLDNQAHPERVVVRLR